MSNDKMRGEWFWCDRWMGSSAFLLPLEARGLYREMLTQAWLRGARLPNDHGAIRRAVGADPEEWARAWPHVSKYWRVDGEDIVNDTQLEIYAETLAQRDRTHARAVAGANARHLPNKVPKQVLKHEPKQVLKQVLEHCPPDPSPSPSQRNNDNDVDGARGLLREALEAARGKHPGLNAQQILDLPAYQAPSGPVRLETCQHAALMRATAGKLRRALHPPKRARGAPAWDRGDDEAEAMQARAADWVKAHWAPSRRLETMPAVIEALAGLSPPADLAGAIREHLVFGIYPHLRTTNHATQTPKEAPNA